MVFGDALGELLLLAAMIIVGGVATGILAGLFGIGGGAVIVPVLYEVFRALGVPDEVRMQLCVGTSLAIIVPTTVRSYLAHRAKGYPAGEIVRMWAVPAVLGVGVGSVIAAFAPSAVFKLAFIVVAGVIAMKLLLGRENWRLGDDLPGRGLMAIFGFVIGLASSLMGVGGGAISNTILTLYGKPLHNAVAVSAGLGVAISIAGAIGYALAGLRYQPMMPPLSLGFVSFLGLALMAPISTYTASFGVRLAHSLSKRHLEIAFGFFLLAVCVRFIVTLV